MARPWRLQTRILIPFVLIALVSIVVTAYVALAVVSSALEARVISRIQDAATVMSQSEFALNPAILHNAGQIAGADILTYQDDGTVLASTTDPASRPELVRAVARPNPQGAIVRQDGPAVRRVPCDVPCLVAYAPMMTRPGAWVAVVAETSERSAATGALTRTILLTAAASLLAMILVSHVVTRRVTAPIDALVAFTREVSAQGTSRRAPVGDDETGTLGAAFNDMLDRLDHARAAQVQSEKLGLAGLMAARVAHDIRNPLASMKMQAQVLAANAPAESLESEALTAILRDIRQIETVVLDLIELARPGNVRRSDVRLDTIVRDVLDQLAAQFTHRRIEVTLDLAPDVPMVSLDVERFRRALLNVLNNASDAMTTGGRLQVRTLRDGEGVALDVIDEGAGIDPTIRDRLFSPFVSTKRDGVGLGLVNAKAIVEQHGGRIELAPVQPHGTRARISLPALRPLTEQT